jgi:hypothetical protein
MLCHTAEPRFPEIARVTLRLPLTQRPGSVREISHDIFRNSAAGNPEASHRC